MNYLKLDRVLLIFSIDSVTNNFLFVPDTGENASKVYFIVAVVVIVVVVVVVVAVVVVVSSHW